MHKSLFRVFRAFRVQSDSFRALEKRSGGIKGYRSAVYQREHVLHTSMVLKDVEREQFRNIHRNLSLDGRPRVENIRGEQPNRPPFSDRRSLLTGKAS